MKKVSILIIAIIALVTSYAQAQNKQSSNWNISLGVGASSSEAMNLGFAQGAQIGYSVGVFEFGASFSHAFAQTPSSTKRHGLGYWDEGREASVQISQGTKNQEREFSSANTSSFNLYVGINPLKWIKDNKRNNLTLALLAGIGAYDSSFMIDDPKGQTVDVRYGTLWSYGARCSYEYMLTSRVGLGLSFTYDMAQQNFYGLTKVSVHF